MRRELASIGIRSPLALLRAARNFARTVWDPSRSDIQHGINKLVSEALREATPEQIAAMEREQPQIAALYTEGYDPALDPARLEALPDGTLGREYARFIRDNCIDPLATLLAMGPSTNVMQYSFRRAYKLHDLMHVVLGCDASILGEVRIVSWSLGQTRGARPNAGRAPGLALAVLLLHLALRRPADLREAVRLAGQWLDLGERSRPHVPVRLEDHLDRPVAEVRAFMLAAA